MAFFGQEAAAAEEAPCPPIFVMHIASLSPTLLPCLYAPKNQDLELSCLFSNSQMQT